MQAAAKEVSTHGLVDTKRTPDEFRESYRGFLLTHLENQNRLGQLVLIDVNHARLSGFMWLRDNGDPSPSTDTRATPQWQHTGVKSKSGRNLQWRVFTNSE